MFSMDLVISIEERNSQDCPYGGSLPTFNVMRFLNADLNVAHGLCSCNRILHAWSVGERGEMYPELYCDDHSSHAYALKETSRWSTKFFAHFFLNREEREQISG